MIQQKVIPLSSILDFYPTKILNIDEIDKFLMTFCKGVDRRKWF